MQRIVLDLRWVKSETLDGIARVSLCYAAELLRLESSSHQYLLLFSSVSLKRFCLRWLAVYDKTPLTPFLALVSGFDARSLRNRTLLPKLLKPFRPTVYFSFYYIFHPLKCDCLQIAMVHDLTPLKYPDYFKQASRLFRLLLCSAGGVKSLLRATDVIITVSKSTQRDLFMLGISKQVHVLPLASGLGKAVMDSATVLPFPKQNFILQVGRSDPHKNQVGLLEAYAKLPAHLKKKYALIFAGPIDSRYTPQLKKRIRELSLDSQVFLTGAVSGAELQLLYAQADVMVMPSFYEGFGLPILEAMEQGTPVIAANKASLPEVAAHAALYFEPEDPASLTQQLTHLLSSKSLCKKYGALGFENVKRFSWQKTAINFLKLLENDVIITP